MTFIRPSSLFFIGTASYAHICLFWNLQTLFPGDVRPFFAMMLAVLLPAAVFYRQEAFRLRLMSFVAAVFYVWMGFLILTTLAFSARDALELGAWALDWAAGSRIRERAFGEGSVAVALGLGVALFIHALREAGNIRIRKMEVKTSRLPEGRERLRIVALSDMHLTPTMRREELARRVALANAQHPDMTVMLGDAMDGEFAPDGEEAELLSRLGGALGRFAVVGNHEFYSGIRSAVRFIEGAGFTLLRGQVAEAGGIGLAGMDDRLTKGRDRAAAVLRRADPEKFVLLLSHRPEAPEDAVGYFDLMLSGHTHGGQVWPGGIAMKILCGLGQGRTLLSAPAGRPRRQSLVYIGNGTGYWGPPVRLFAPPEITVVDLCRVTADAAIHSAVTSR